MFYRIYSRIGRTFLSKNSAIISGATYTPDIKTNISLLNESKSQPTISDNELNDYYDMINDNNVDLTDEQLMTLFDSDEDSEEQFSELSFELGHTIA